MPPRIDLAGKKFGKLTIIKRVGDVKFGRVVSNWLVRCDCGREETYPLPRIPYRESIAKTRHAVWACSVCRQPNCVVCGKPVPLGRKHNTCSAECNAEKIRKTQRDSKRRKAAADPEYNRRQHKIAKHRPGYRDRIKKAYREKWAKQREAEQKNPELREKRLVEQRRRYLKKAVEIQEKRKAAYAALSPEKKQKWDERAKKYNREWRRKWLYKVFSTPSKYERHLKKQREYRRAHELRKMIEQSAKILTKKE